jgi:hypothetical protein
MVDDEIAVSHFDVGFFACFVLGTYWREATGRQHRCFQNLGLQQNLWVDFRPSGPSRPVGFWTTSLLPTGPTGSSRGYVDNRPVAHIPTAIQVSDIQIMSGATAQH